MHNREVYGGDNYTSPYILVGQKNSSNMPGVVFCSSHDSNCGCEHLILGEQFIAYSSQCWPAGAVSIPRLLSKAVSSGMLYKDLEAITQRKEKSNPWRTSRAYKAIYKSCPILGPLSYQGAYRMRSNEYIGKPSVKPVDLP